MKLLLRTSSYPFLLLRLITGLIFFSEGIQKFVRPDDVGSSRFAKIGFSDPVFWAHFTGYFEIICGTLLVVGLITRLASIPLLIIMTVAFFKTKLTILQSNGFLPFAHEYRTDFAMTMLLFLFLIYGAGRTSFDLRLSDYK